MSSTLTTSSILLFESPIIVLLLLPPVTPSFLKRFNFSSILPLFVLSFSVFFSKLLTFVCSSCVLALKLDTKLFTLMSFDDGNVIISIKFFLQFKIVSIFFKSSSTFFSPSMIAFLLDSKCASSKLSLPTSIFFSLIFSSVQSSKSIFPIFAYSRKFC